MAGEAKVGMLLLLIMITLLVVATVAARPMEGRGGAENASMKMVMQMLDSRSDPRSHCC
jgi:hypothetical protein